MALSSENAMVSLDSFTSLYFLSGKTKQIQNQSRLDSSQNMPLPLKPDDLKSVGQAVLYVGKFANFLLNEYNGLRKLKKEWVFLGSAQLAPSSRVYPHDRSSSFLSLASTET